MAADEVTLGVGIEADTGSASKDMHAVADAVATLSDAMRELTSSIKPLATQLDKVERGAAGIAKTQKQAAQSTEATTKAIREQAQAAAALNNTLQRNVGNLYQGNNGTQRVSTASTVNRPDIGVVSKQDIESQRASNYAREQAIKLIEAERKALLEKVKANAAENRAWIAANDRRTGNGMRETGVGESAREVAQRMEQYSYAAKGAAGSTSMLRDNLFTARFALHDISNATGIAGAALVAFNAYAIKAAADYESAMASIDRTTGATAGQMRLIRDQFIGLAQEIPAGFENIAQIGELAGQLNIPAGQIASFTETVAQFTSSTDVSVQSSAEAFGRLDTLLPDVQGNYNALGSSILNVGVNSVATESAIISTTTQIAAAGAQARFTASEVIGLAASYASLGIAPEAARGSTIRIFSEIRQAALEGGEGLEEFARLAGSTADEFRSQWLSGDSSQAFIDFLQGLQREGANAETTLRNLGVTGVRDINALLRLSQNLDIVTQSFGYAGDGFEQGTQLAEAFGITSQTLNSRVQVLGQSFQAFFAELGSGSTGPIKEFVNLLIDVLKTMTEIARNPASQWIAIFGAVFTLLAGGTLIITSLVTRMGAAAVAMRTVNEELRKMVPSATASGAAMTGLQGKLVSAGVAATTFSNILKGIGWATAITAGLTIAITAVQAFVDATQSSADKARAAFGDLSSLTSALQSDTQDVAAGTQEAFGTIEGSITKTVPATADWVKNIESATGAQTTLAAEVDRTRNVIDEYTYSIGRNTAAWLSNQLVNNQNVVDAFKQLQRVAELGGPSLDANKVISSAIKGDIDEANRILEEFRVNVENKTKEIGGASDAGLLQAQGVYMRFKEAVNLVDGALAEAATKGQITALVNESLGIATNAASTEMFELGEEAVTTADKLTELRNATTEAFQMQNDVATFAGDISTLFSGIYDGAVYGADAFNVFGAAGQTNLGNLQSAIVSTITAGSALGISAVDSVSALFVELQRQGIDTAHLMASLANIPGIGTKGVAQIKQTVAGQRQLTGSSAALSETMRQLAVNAPRAAKGIGGTGGAAKQAAAEVRTLSDYAGDLEKVFNRAFEIRFGSQQAMDKITGDWIKMQEAINDAGKAIDEANRKMNELRVDNSILEHFLGVAQNYGDTLRAADIQQQIAKNNADIAAEADKANAASAAFNKTLDGNSKEAIDNRAQITGLVSSYQSLIAEYARSGMTQDQLNAKTAELRAQFIQQATQLGFNSAQLDRYTAAFDDVTLAIGRVPRNVTVQADINPAITALRELEARAAQSGAQAARNFGGGFSGAGVGLNLPPIWPDGTEAARRWKQQWNTATQTWQMRDATTGAWVKTGMQLYRSGGYTGDAPRNEISGMVHGKEFVVNAENTQRLGLGFLNALNSGATPMAPANPGIMVVELSARDRALLAAAGNVQVVIPGQAIANATNGANFVSSKRGAS